MSRLLAVVLIVVGVVGCGPQRPPMAKVTGKVTYRGKPLTFGSLQFQPAAGQPGRGYIQPDGTFELSTYGDRDGAQIGKHTVRITCLTSQDPNAKPSTGEASAGTSLIPAKYGALATTPLTDIEVKEVNEPMVFDLKD